MLVSAGRNHSINASCVAYMRWDRPEGRNSTLIVTMVDGTEIRLEHRPYYLDGNDCYKIEREIIAACNG